MVLVKSEPLRLLALCIYISSGRVIPSGFSFGAMFVKLELVCGVRGKAQCQDNLIYFTRDQVKA